MQLLIWLVDKLLPITSIIGLLCLLLTEFAVPMFIWIIGVACFVLGVLFGIVAWKYDAPPRWFWVKSKMELFENKICYALGYGIRFFFIPFAVFALIMIFSL